ncbi:Two-component response regulator, YesN/AraC family, consists of REC and AraC-type DNA-binding domains [Paenibacillus sp. UNCCL117]|uniref:helix-turn-helix domain-containing protein n=1 Tax=unclassified Paenibacillus TaxID=185978 RepID=UPI000881AA00|nr:MULTISPECIES: helix-turn-helix domain-containing protein [unclassified Paenibacillus]SDD13259.1 Two-component response regulator, YesN/AraC family, consists of REC and AraC-type DNA-binding domains [Paenibacillus sp. cl123]SFW33948.1 Two-component response regulator, YesN/AraC family, consists of REC and AraC-type DNA-binding domains [Paenibacillus sp. UNCCL117]
MTSFPGKHSFRAALFRRHFASYFVLILIPVIVACALAHLLVVRLIEEDARKLNDVMMARLSEQTDTAFHSLQTNMINMLTTSNIRSLLKVAGDTSLEDPQRSELIRSLREQLGKLESDQLAARAFLYFANHDLVIDADAYTDRAYFFQQRYPMEEREKHELVTGMSGRKMLDFAMAGTEHMSVLMSYPYNTDMPEVYLVVQINQARLAALLDIPENWAAGTALMGPAGQLIGQSGLNGEDASELARLIRLQERVQASDPASGFHVTGERAISLVKSGFDDSYAYLSIVDLPVLMKPASVTQVISWGFLLFFLVVGSFVSYHLSRRIYKPIMEIKENLKLHRSEGGQTLRAGGNEFDAIKRFSQLIVTENRKLSQRVDGMLPILQEYFIAKILLGEYKDALAIKFYAEEIDFNYARKASRTVFCIALHYDAYSVEPLSETSKTFLVAELKEQIQGLIPSPVWLCQTKPELLACVAQDDPLLHVTPEEHAEMIKLALKLHGKYYKAAIGIGRKVHAIEQLHQSYEQAVHALQRRSLQPDVEICDGRVAWEPPVCETFLSVQEITRVLNRYKSRDYDQLLQGALQMLEDGVKRRVPAAQMKYVCSDLLNTWIRAVETERKDFDMLFYAGLFEQMNRCMTGDELRRCFIAIHEQLFPESEEESRAKKLTDIVDYIHAHYNEELSIEQFASQLNMSVGHFSRTFKEEVGEKYVEYIAKYRLQKAKELLLATDLRIDDIAEKVGYWGRHSFIRVFRKYEGVTPAKYRMSQQC